MPMDDHSLQQSSIVLLFSDMQTATLLSSDRKVLPVYIKSVVRERVCVSSLLISHSNCGGTQQLERGSVNAKYVSAKNPYHYKTTNTFC